MNVSGRVIVPCGYIKFTGDYSSLISSGYKFSNKSSACYFQGRDSDDVWIYRKYGGYVYLSDFRYFSYLLAQEIIENKTDLSSGSVTLDMLECKFVSYDHERWLTRCMVRGKQYDRERYRGCYYDTFVLSEVRRLYDSEQIVIAPIPLWQLWEKKWIPSR